MSDSTKIKYVPYQIKRTDAKPLDSMSVISSFDNIDTEIPVSLRYDGEIVYSINEDKFYYLKKSTTPDIWNAIPMNIEGTDVDTVIWNVRNDADSEYYDYTDLSDTLNKIFENSIKSVGFRVCKIIPLNIDFYLGYDDSSKIVIGTDYYATQIYFNKINFTSTTYGPEVSSFLQNSKPIITSINGSSISSANKLPFNADIHCMFYINSDGNQMSGTNKRFRINYDEIVDYIPSLSSMKTQKFIAGRMYIDNGFYKVCNGNSNDYDSLIRIGNKSGASVKIMELNGLSVSNCYKDPYPTFGKEDSEKNALVIKGSGSVYSVSLIYEYDKERYKIIPFDFYYISYNNNIVIYLKSKYYYNNKLQFAVSCDVTDSSGSDEPAINEMNRTIIEFGERLDKEESIRESTDIKLNEGLELERNTRISEDTNIRNTRVLPIETWKDVINTYLIKADAVTYPLSCEITEPVLKEFTGTDSITWNLEWQFIHMNKKASLVSLKLIEQGKTSTDLEISTISKTVNVPQTIPGQVRYTVTGEVKNNIDESSQYYKSASATTYMNLVRPIFVGHSLSENITSVDILNNINAKKYIQESIKSEYVSVETNNDYIYFCFPKELDNLHDMSSEGFEFSYQKLSDVMVTLGSYSDNYSIYRSLNKLTGTWNIIVS